MNNCEKYYCNKECKYYPCHTGVEEFNCMFCFCPLYWVKCPGTHTIFEKEGLRMKNCMDCTFPHKPENYDKIIQILRKPVPFWLEKTKG